VFFVFCNQSTVAASKVTRSSGVAAREYLEVRKADRGRENNKRRVFWMRDLTTGNIIWENHVSKTHIAKLS
jgi:hypothetical protein